VPKLEILPPDPIPTIDPTFKSGTPQINHNYIDTNKKTPQEKNSCGVLDAPLCASY